MRVLAVYPLLTSPFFVLFGVIALGALLGAFRVRGVSVGAAGVFFVALVAGHFLGQRQWMLAHELTEFGLLLFVYAVGLQAGPRFFATFRRRGLAFLAIGVGSTLAAAAATVVLAVGLDLSAHLAAGLFAGATTCTPALASAVETVRRFLPDEVSSVAVGYGASYPFSVAAVVLVVQVLPLILRTSPAVAAARFAESVAEPPLEECAFRLSNPNCAGCTIEELQSLRISQAVLCRVKQGGTIRPARPDTTLHLGDTVLAVGTPTELAKLEAVLGEVVVESMYDPSGNVTSEQVLVSRRDAIGKTLRELCLWERFGVVVTRVRREGLEFTPRGDLRLEPGDLLRVVGPRQDIAAVTQVVGREERRLNETSLVPFAAGIALGAAVGQIPIPLPGGMQSQLGLAGGAFLVALLLGHWGTIGPVRVYVPNAAKHFARELGLVIFLAGAGLGAGQRFVPIFQETGPKLLAVGAAVTLAAVATAVFLMFVLLRWNLLFGAGALCACMTNPPGLAAATELTDSDAAAVGFASVYPVALIAKIAAAPLVFLVLRLFA